MNYCTSFTTGLRACMWCVRNPYIICCTFFFGRVLSDYISMIALKLYKASRSALSSQAARTVLFLPRSLWLLWRKRGGSYEAALLSWGSHLKQMNWIESVLMCVYVRVQCCTQRMDELCKYQNNFKWMRRLSSISHFIPWDHSKFEKMNTSLSKNRE